MPGNCTSRKDSTNYMLFEEVVREIITRNKHVIRSEYSFDNCISALSRRIFYSVEGDYNLNIHQSGTRTISATPATFNSATLVSTPGKLVLICNGCGATYTDEYSYHEAKWFKYFNGGNYYKVYANNCDNVFSREDVDKWQIVINTNGGKFDDINTIPSTCNIKDNFTISILEDYDLSYPGHKFSGFEVYIDGVKQELEYLKETGRYYTVEYNGGYLEHFFRVGMFENLDKEYIGDIYIKLLWE